MTNRILCVGLSSEACREIDTVAERFGGTLQCPQELGVADALIDAGKRRSEPFNILVVSLGRSDDAGWIERRKQEFQACLIVGDNFTKPETPGSDGAIRRSLAPWASPRSIAEAVAECVRVLAVARTQQAHSREEHPMSDPAFEALVGNFTRKLPLVGGEIRDALASGDLTKVKVLSHRLRGTAPSYGFPMIGNAAGEVEDSLKASAAMSAIQPLVDRFVTTLLEGDYR